MRYHFLKLWEHFLTDHLFRNSMYLMMTTGAMGAFGFFFWIICTHLFTPAQIGIGTTLISAMTLISLASLLGFNTTFIRFLPNSQNRNDAINTGSLLVISMAALLAIAYIILIPTITPQLEIIRQNIWYALGFIAIVASVSITSLTDSIFISFRSTHFNLLTNGLTVGIMKLILPMLFVGFGAYGVFAAFGLAASFGTIVAILFLYFKFEYRPQLKIDVSILKKVFSYSFTNYFVNLTNISPALVLPIIVINRLGADAAAYYYLAFMIINLLYTVSGSVSQSLFAEGSHAGNNLRNLIRNSLVILASIMLPAGIILALFGPLVLQFFGKSYSAGGSDVIVLLALAAPAVAAYNLGSSLLRIRQQTRSLLIASITYSALIISLSLLWADKGLVWIAVAWMAGNTAAAIVSFFAIYLYRHHPTPVPN